MTEEEYIEDCKRKLELKLDRFRGESDTLQTRDETVKVIQDWLEENNLNVDVTFEGKYIRRM